MKSVRQYEQGYTVILPTLQKWFKNGLVSGFVLEKILNHSKNSTL